MANEWDADTLFDVFERADARRILALTSVEAMSAKELAERCDASEATIYRRIDVLQDHDLVVERERVDDDGNHFRTYETNLDEVRFRLRDGGFDIDVTYRRDLVDDV
ncbi:ArsR/SmtB family transcription factor [Haloarchaeobius sp. HRN-SO-5]|uniref:ArsR/SmtB family transcription factor n=1 Tax=Haloarchaeobius sp. HRN-SO-5 TaxID=3446118 RepID=UPI003EBC948A